eukprot:1264386-Pleurochrysis_carterae.AAC.2
MRHQSVDPAALRVAVATALAASTLRSACALSQHATEARGGGLSCSAVCDVHAHVPACAQPPQKAQRDTCM